MSAPLVIVGTVRVPPEQLDAARSTMRAMIEASRAEPGCLVYSYAEDVLEPGLIRVSEVWESRAALEAHFASPHIAAWRQAWPTLGISDRQLTLYSAESFESV